MSFQAPGSLDTCLVRSSLRNPLEKYKRELASQRTLWRR